MLTKQIIEAYINDIKTNIHDYEVAHSNEDDLYEYFIRSIAIGEYNSNEIKELAALTLTTKELKFARHCA